VRRTPRCARPEDARKGFTLIELLVVLILIAMLSTAIVPSVASALNRGGIRATGEKLCELLDFAYMSAVTRRCPVVLNLHAERRRCWVSMTRPSLPWMEESGEQGSRVLGTMALPEGTGLAVTLGENSAFGMEQSTAWETITFQSDGRTDDVSIELTGPAGERFLIQVLGATGEVHGEEQTP
jgi:prepilin-type N-terminal cleavage/methylation domain-containing protein